MHTFSRAHARAVSAGAMTVTLGSLAAAPKVALTKPGKRGLQDKGSHAQ